MNMLVKKVVVLTATSMIGTSCFAMLPEDLATDREKERATAAPITTTTTTFPEVYDLSGIDADVVTGVIHPPFVIIAEADKEDFKNMLLVSQDWFHCMTGTGTSQGREYPKYDYPIRGQAGFGNYASSQFLKELHQIQFSEEFDNIGFYDIREGYAPFPASLECHFPCPQALTRLDISYNASDFMGQTPLKNFINLEHFDISYTVSLASPNWLSGPKALPKLKNLNLSYVPSSIDYISGLTTLETLIMPYCAPRGPQWLNNLENLHKLKTLDLQGNTLHEAKAEIFAGFTDLEVLDLSCCTLTETNCLASLTNPHKIKVLTLYSNYLRSIKPEFLSGFTNLEEVNLADCDLEGPQWLSALETCTQVKGLDLHNNELTNANGANFLAFSQLQYLDIADNQIENFPLLPEGLDTLIIDGNTVKGHCNQLPLSLTALAIHNTVYDPLTDEDLLSLTRLTDLEELVLDLKISDNVRKELRKKFPKIRFVIR